MTVTTTLAVVNAAGYKIQRIERTYSFESPDFEENPNANEYQMAKFTRPPQIDVNDLNVPKFCFIYWPMCFECVYKYGPNY